MSSQTDLPEAIIELDNNHIYLFNMINDITETMKEMLIMTTYTEIYAEVYNIIKNRFSN